MLVSPGPRRGVTSLWSEGSEAARARSAHGPKARGEAHMHAQTRTTTHRASFPISPDPWSFPLTPTLMAAKLPERNALIVVVVVIIIYHP